MSSPTSSVATFTNSNPPTLADILGSLEALGPELARLLGSVLTSLETPIPLEQWRDQTLKDYGARAKTTRLRMRQALAETLDLAGPGATTSALTAELVARLAARGGAASTVNGLLASLRAACRIAIRRRQLSAARLEGAAWRVRPREGPRTPRHHGRAEIARVLDHLSASRDSWEGGRLHALAAVYAYAGLRRNEALHLRARDVDLDRGFLFIVPNGRALKTEHSAAPVPLPAELVRILGDWIPRCHSEWLFPNRNRRSPWTGGTTGQRAGDRLVRAGRAVGVDGFTPLSLRHSLATHLTSHWGLTDKQIQQVLRHTTVLTQRHYVHPDLANLGELVRDFRYHHADDPRPPRRLRADRPRPILGGRTRRRPQASLRRPAA